YWAFDYWGKGTMVTVTSASPTKPTLFPLVASCGSGTSGDVVALGCLATGFLPDSLTFKWTDSTEKELTPFRKYPSVLNGETYSSTSQLSLPTSDWNSGKAFFCEAKHPQGDVKVTFAGTPPVPPASVLLNPPSLEELAQNHTATLVCVASGFSPKTHEFKWWRGNTKLDEGVTNIPATEDEKKLYSASSLLTVTEKDWKSSAEFACEFVHKTGSVLKNITYTSPECQETVKVVIEPPTNEEQFVKNTATLTCRAIGLVSTSDVSMTWSSGGKPLAAGAPEFGHEGGKIVAVSRVSVVLEKWRTGTEYKCIVSHLDSFPTPITKTYKRQIATKIRPSVFLLAPSTEESSSTRDEVTLTCFVKDFSPKDIYISWLAQDSVVDKTHYTVTDLIPSHDGTYSVYSKYTISSSDWNSGTMYSCAVHHETAPLPVSVITRTTDSSTGKATLDGEVEESDHLWKTVSAFLSLFLITLFYSIVATITKVS
uniref:Ig-like domain-containing protein n=1 Tax=Lepisosteus oculatus TaxID=7918 RepID=W5LZS3_LEPOC